MKKLIKKFVSKDKKYKYFLYEMDNYTLYGEHIGLVQGKGLKEIIDMLPEYYKKWKRKINLLIGCKDLTGIDMDARKIIKDVLVNKRDIVNKLAAFEINFFVRNFINLYSVISKVPIKGFKSMQDAKKWVKV